MYDNATHLTIMIKDYVDRNGGYKKALEVTQIRRTPRKLRRAAKMVKKVIRALQRIDNGQSCEPIALHHYFIW